MAKYHCCFALTRIADLPFPSGSICALATPFDQHGAVDKAAFERLLERQLAHGTQGLVVAGSTGEAHMLEQTELAELVRLAVSAADGKVPVLVGTGTAGTGKTIEATRRAAELGADAALVVTPYYVRPTQDGMRRHFLEVAERGGMPIVLYNVPSRTACDLLPATVATLRDHPQIVGIKEAVGDAGRNAGLAALVGPEFGWLSGDDRSSGNAMLAGACGTISVVANLVPGLFRRFCDLARGGDGDEVRRISGEFGPLLDALDCAPNPVPIKAALARLELCTAVVRPPLYPMEPDSDAQRKLCDVLNQNPGILDDPTI